MHLIETYACASGATIDRCFISEKLIELPKKKYITLHAYNPKGSCRQYSYWQDVIDGLQKHPKFDYDIIQIGGKKDYRYKNINRDYLGKTDYATLAFLIHHCELHMGYDSFPIHLASHYDKKIVGLYPHFAKNSGPFFNQKSPVITIESDIPHHKPIFLENAPNDRIDSIHPQLIINSVNKLLFDLNYE